jgi:hypothetical protein
MGVQAASIKKKAKGEGSEGQVNPCLVRRGERGAFALSSTSGKKNWAMWAVWSLAYFE